ncbi:hypothetical protein J5U23_01438 [Saccharolobus shibatae B12]|uniref:Uncharacterized protein n=1 Tax=Saccharolobus shibatae (strain ATCC 51178 / DSM 5389 / JCM 8931 / NBRC 15437 / B12) TaxID=523848 RepID=A0A8F5BNR7_SACSH|nr:hypothetical protein [Saccharolobus shibatae]QXJ28569.1 hypothetical protein J5U23_01438 [Saccharolobus shibatae B12]
MVDKAETRLLFKHIDILILIILDLLLAIDFTRLGNIYNIDNPIFPYLNPITAYKYLLLSLYGYNPWLGTISQFYLGTFLVNFPIFIFSNLPLSGTFFDFSLLLLGSLPLYKLTREMLPHDNTLITILAGYASVLFFALNPQGAGGLNSSMLTSVYTYAFLPLLLYSIRKFFLSDNFSQSVFWLLIMIPIFFMEYYYSIPVYTLPLAILLFTFFVFYGIKSLLSHHYFRVILLLSLIGGYLYLKIGEMISIYQSFTNPGFIKISYYYWVTNAQAESLSLTLRGLNANFGIPPANIYYFSLILAIIYLFIPINRETRKRGEALFMLSEFLLFTFLYSMPNVPFSSFWEKLFFEFPIMTDLRTQYVLITPFQGLLMSIAFGLGSYGFIKSLSYKKIGKIVSLILVFISIIGVSFSILAYGPSGIVHVPQEFLNTVNFINSHSSYNLTVLILPIFGTEDSQSWYHGPSLFPLFLKPLPILGGYYYSVSSEMFNTINGVYYHIYEENTSSKSMNYVKNFFYLFNVRYIIVEKTAVKFGPLVIFSPYGSYSYSSLKEGIQNFTKLNVLKLSYNNSLYFVYSTDINSSLGLISFENYSITYILNSSNITRLLIPIQVIYISPAEYILKLENITNSTLYLYLMIPYSEGWNITGAKVISHSNYYGYNLFKIETENKTMHLINSEVIESIPIGVKSVGLELVLPFILAVIVRSKIGKLIGSKIRLRLLRYF